MRWLQELDEGQRRVGFNGRAVHDVNKMPVMARGVLRVGLPAKFSLIAAAPLPARIAGVTPRLLAFGLERPLVERDRWTVTWRGYGQVGAVKGAFTCPQEVLAFAPRSPENSTGCTGTSDDMARLQYAGMEFQYSRRLRRWPKLVPHASVGGNFIDAS